MKTETSRATPIHLKDRIIYLDILRGIAIYFIFTANIAVFSGYLFLSQQQVEAFPTYQIDKVLDFLMFTLVDGKFYSIFSLLFGIGFVVQYNNLQKSGKPFNAFFRRRMFWLLIIGLCHLCFFWLGDILTLYALLGFALILFKNASNKKLIIWAIVLILAPIAHALFMKLTENYYPRALYRLYSSYWAYLELPIRDIGNGIMRPDNSYYFGSTDLVEFFKINLGRPLIRFANILLEGRAFKVLGIFLIGIWAGRKIMNEGLLKNTILLRKILYVGLALGLPFSIFRTFIEFSIASNSNWEIMYHITYALGTVPLAMAYAALIALFCQFNSAKLNWFAPVGRMALSNYLLQTLISIILFYGIGFGLFGKFGFLEIMGIATLIIFLQMFLSRLWLTYFKYGPFEWIWRQLTYGKRMSIRKAEHIN